jgi:carbamoyltransferase
VKVLGINAVFHDPAASLVLDGRIVAAAEEERFSRLLELARWLHAETGEAALTMAGGVALNCVANARIASQGPFREVWVHGPTPPALWGPPPGGLHTVLWKGRRSDPLADRPAPGLLAIRPREVTTALAAL